MTTTPITAKKTAGDLLRWEQGGNRSREAGLVAQSQTLVFGQVVKKTSNGFFAAVGALVDDVQTMKLTGSLSGGTFLLGFIEAVTGDRIWTDPIAYGADTAAIQAGIDTALGGSKCVASGTPITAAILTFSGTGYSGKEQPLIEMDISALTAAEDANMEHTTVGGQGGAGSPVNEVQLLAIAGTLTSGTFTVTGRKSTGESATTTALAYGSTTGDMQTALDTAFGTDQIIAGGTAITAQTLTFSGDEYAGSDVDTFTVDAALTVGMTSAKITTTTHGGPAGSGDAYGIMLEAITTTSAEVKTVIAARECTVNEEEIIYAPGNRRDAIEDLIGRGFVIQREGTQIFS